MKALILAAGYGTRLARDIENDASGRYANLLGVPKPLLPIGKPQQSAALGRGGVLWRERQRQSGGSKRRRRRERGGETGSERRRKG